MQDLDHRRVVSHVDEGVHVLELFPVPHDEVDVAGVHVVLPFDRGNLHDATSTFLNTWPSATIWVKCPESSDGIFCVCSVTRIPARLEGLVEHPDHLHALCIAEMEQHVLAHHEAEMAPDGHELLKVVVMRGDDLPDPLDDAVLAGAVSIPRPFDGFEISLEVLLRDPLDLLVGIDARLDDLQERRIVIGGVDVHIAECESPHALGQQDRERVGLVAHGAAGVPDAHVAPAHHGGDEVLHGKLQAVSIPKEKSERHGQFNPPCALRDFSSISALRMSLGTSRMRATLPSPRIVAPDTSSTLL